MSTYAENKGASEMLNELDNKINRCVEKIKDYEYAILLLNNELKELAKQKDMWADYYYNSEVDCNNEARREEVDKEVINYD